MNVNQVKAITMRTKIPFHALLHHTSLGLESTTNSVSVAVWNTNSPAPVVIAGLNIVTQPLSGAQQFFRLISK